MRQKEVFKLKVHRYRTPEGQPTCAINFEKGDVCMFYRTQRFGTFEVCEFASKRIERPKDYLAPVDNCPIWKGAT